MLHRPHPLFRSCGCKLSADDHYKIDKTAMGEVLSKEQGVASRVVPEEVGVVSELEGEGEELEGIADGEREELSMELEEILKTCSQAQPKPAVQAEVSDAGTVRAQWCRLQGQKSGIVVQWSNLCHFCTESLHI